MNRLLICDRIYKNKQVSEKSIIANVVVQARRCKGTKEKEVCLSPRLSIRLDSNLDGSIFAQRKRQQSNKKGYYFSR